MATTIPESKEKKVLFWTHWHDRGFDEGLERGLEQAREEARARGLRLVERNWRRRFSAELPSALQASLGGLDADRLDQFGAAILDFNEPAEAERWLSSLAR